MVHRPPRAWAVIGLWAAVLIAWPVVAHGLSVTPALAATSPLPTPTRTAKSPIATPTRVPPTATRIRPTPTRVPPTATASPTPTRIPPTATRIAPTATGVPGTNILGYHVVRSGETLYCIARAYVVLPSAIASTNGIPSPYALGVGRSLAIPNVPWQNMPAGPTCARQVTTACRRTYVVQRGDTLYSIAARHQTTVWVIMADNHLTNPSAILPGQKLCIR